MAPKTTVLENETKPCTKCTKVLPLSSFYTTGKKRNGTPKYNSWCRECTKEKMATYHKQTWGLDKLNFSAARRTRSVRSFLSYLRAKAVHRKGECISLDALETLWFSQNGKCAFTGWPMTMELTKGVVSTNCSIDRKDSSLGYVPGNVQLVCRAVNIAKHDLSGSDFLQLCRAVLENTNG